MYLKCVDLPCLSFSNSWTVSRQISQIREFIVSLGTASFRQLDRLNLLCATQLSVTLILCLTEAEKQASGADACRVVKSIDLTFDETWEGANQDKVVAMNACQLKQVDDPFFVYVGRGSHEAEHGIVGS